MNTPPRDEFRIPSGSAEAEMREKASRFIARAYPVSKVDDVDEILGGLRKKYFDATHHCFAYRFADEFPEPGHGFDAGEPAGSAGQPILRAIHGADLWDILIVVTRYYGGTKLGTGGLIRAYGGVAAEALSVMPVAQRILTETLTLRCDYQQLSVVYHVASLTGAVPEVVGYDPEPRVAIPVRLSRIDTFREQLTDRLGGNVRWE